MSAFEMIAIGFAAAIGLAALTFWGMMIYDCATKTPPRSRERYVWLLIVATWSGGLLPVDETTDKAGSDSLRRALTLRATERSSPPPRAAPGACLGAPAGLRAGPR